MTHKVTDIEGTELKVGDEVYYARKRDYMNNGTLIKLKITSIGPNFNVRMGKYLSTTPFDQLVKIK